MNPTLSWHAIVEAIYTRGFAVIDELLTENHYQALYMLSQNRALQGQFKKAAIGRAHLKQENLTIRNDSIAWLDPTDDHPAIRAYFQILHLLNQALNQYLYLGLREYEAHFSIYKPQGFYKKHIDQFESVNHRRISCVYYLNPEWSPAFGGELKLYNTKDQWLATIEPRGNCFVCFSSDLPHEVLPTTQTRYSIAAWLKTRPIWP